MEREGREGHRDFVGNADGTLEGVGLDNKLESRMRSEYRRERRVVPKEALVDRTVRIGTPGVRIPEVAVPSPLLARSLTVTIRDAISATPAISAGVARSTRRVFCVAGRAVTSPAPRPVRAGRYGTIRFGAPNREMG